MLQSALNVFFGFSAVIAVLTVVDTCVSARAMFRQLMEEQEAARDQWTSDDLGLPVRHSQSLSVRNGDQELVETLS